MRILVVDDDLLVTRGLTTIIESASRTLEHPYTVIATARNGREAFQAYQAHQPDICLMDIRMPEMDGIEAGRRILSRYPEAKIIYLTTFQEDNYIIEALQIGAKGYILKTDYDSLIPAIQAVANGQSIFGNEIINRIPHLLNPRSENSSIPLNNPLELNDKELQMIKYLAQGMNNREIAQAMHFSEGTIRNYLSIILEKLDLRDRTQLVIFYYKYLIESEREK